MTTSETERPVFIPGQHVNYAPYGFRDANALAMDAVIVADEGADPLTLQPYLWRYRIRAQVGNEYATFTTKAWNLRAVDR